MLLIESNRKLANQAVESSLSEDSSSTNPSNYTASNAQWETNVNNVRLNPGDVISVANASCNILGSGTGSMIEMKGQQQTKRGDQFLKDNQTTIRIARYITNRHEFVMPLPLSRVRLRRELYVSTNGAVDMDGHYWGNGQHYASKANPQQLDYNAGYNAFTSANPIRAIAGCCFPNRKNDIPPNIHGVYPISNFSVTYKDDQLNPPYDSTNALYYAEITPMSKGPLLTARPNSVRYYLADGSFTGFVYDPTSSGIHLRNETDYKYFDFHTTDVDIEIPKGLQTTGDVSNFVTQAFNEREGNAANYQVHDAQPGFFEFVDLVHPDPTRGTLKFKETNSITSKSYITTETIGGAIMYAKKFGGDWGAAIAGEANASGDVEVAGTYYETPQGLKMSYKHMVCGNPFEMKFMSYFYPRFQMSAFNSSQNTGNFDYTDFNLWTGFTQVATQDGPGTSTLHIGEFGNFACLLNVMPFKTETGRVLEKFNDVYTSATYTYTPDRSLRFHNIKKYNAVVLNLLVNSLTTFMPEALDDCCKNLGDFDSPSNPTTSYYDSFYFDLKLGRIDDEYSCSLRDQIPGSHTKDDGANYNLVNHFLQHKGGTNFHPGIASTSNGSDPAGSYMEFAVRDPSNPESATTNHWVWITTNSTQGNNEAQNRTIPVFKHFPQDVEVKITAFNLYHEKCTWITEFNS